MRSQSDLIGISFLFWAEMDIEIGTKKQWILNKIF